MSAFDAIALELAVRTALDHGDGHIGRYIVRYRSPYATISSSPYELILNSREELAEMVSRMRRMKAAYIDQADADFIRGWLADE